MRFLIDESTGKRLAEILRKHRHDVIFVGDVIRFGILNTLLKSAWVEGSFVVLKEGVARIRKIK